MAQATAVLLLLPVLVSLRGLSLQELPQYVSDGVSLIPQLAASACNAE